jgi:hypothetical protein
MVLSPLARMVLLGFLAALLLFGLFSEPRYGIDPSDLDFAESSAHALLGVPGLANMLSAGLVGLAALVGFGAIARASSRGIVWETGARSSWGVFFGAAAAAAVASIALHASPSLPLLIVMRLCICLAMMGLWNALMIERVDPEIGLKAAPWFYLFAIAAVGYWGWTESLGAGDLRLTTACTVYPMMVLPMILSLFPLAEGGGGWLLAGWGVYLAAKICEALDALIYGSTGEWISGHTLSHIGQALAILCVARSLTARRPATS